MDLITQVQDKLDHLLYVFGTCIGVLQRDAPPSSFNPNQQQENWDVPPKMAIQVIETSKVIESYIERLPGFDKTEGEQYEDLRSLNNQSKEISKDHQMSRAEAIEILKLVKESIRFISEESKKVDKESEEDDEKDKSTKDKSNKPSITTATKENNNNNNNNNTNNNKEEKKKTKTIQFSV